MSAGRGVTRQAVLDYLIHEADLDGLVTVSEREIGEVVGAHQATVSYHITNLAADGLLNVIPGAGGYKSMSAIQLSESVFA